MSELFVKMETMFSSFEILKEKYEVFIIDFDGTLWNGADPIKNTEECCYQLMKDPKNKVLFYTNGGYCSLDYSFKTFQKWF